MVVTNYSTISGNYFCLCYCNLDCEYIGCEEIMKGSQFQHWIFKYLVPCEAYSWEVIGSCAVQKGPTDSSVREVK